MVKGGNKSKNTTREQMCTVRVPTFGTTGMFHVNISDPVESLLHTPWKRWVGNGVSVSASQRPSCLLQ